MDQQVDSAILALKRDALCRWEGATDLEELLGTRGGVLEPICDAYRKSIVLLDLKWRRLKMWAQHRCLQSATSGNTVLRIECS